jgi:hypothetical protein
MSQSRQISATEDTVGGLLSKKYRYIVPEYQRQYSWGEEQWQDLWDDLLELEQSHSHFLGSIVFVERNTKFDETDEYEIVDGQQRITTISILLCALREYYKQKGDEDAANGIENDYLYEQNDDWNDEQKLELNSLDQRQYSRLIEGNPPREDESKIKRAIEFFADEIASLPEDQVEQIRKKLLNSVTLVTINCPNQASAFRLFETLNDRGLELSQVDLMKNYLYQKVSKNPEFNKEAIKQDWEDIMADIRYEMNEPFRFFIHFMLYTPEPNITHSISRNTLYDNFQDLVDNKIPESNISLEQYITKMAQATRLYLNIMNAEISKYDPNSNEKINKLLHDLNRLGFTQERTYLMGVFTHLNNASEVIRGIKLIESYIIRQRFTDHPTGSVVNELFSNICADAFDRDDTISYIQSQLRNNSPSDEELRVAIANNNFARNSRTRFLLEGIESGCYRKQNNNNVPVGEIEHIIPRRAFSAKKYNTWPEYLDCGQAEYDEKKDRLGNLTILERRLNVEASDRPFEQKKNKYSGSDYKMANEISNHDHWSIEQIEERTEALASKAVDVWDFKI